MQEMSHIDLALAVNYLPACACAVQSFLLSFVLCGLHSVRLLPAFVPVCLLLVMERASPRTLRIFDGSAVLFSIFFSHSVAAMQEFSEGGAHLSPAVHALLSVEWPCTSMYLLVRPPASRDWFKLCLAGACFRVSLFAFMYRPESFELRLVRVGRDLAFAGLCLVWTYVVGLYRKRLTHQHTESAAFFAIYFWPILYSHFYTAAAHAVAALAVIVLQLRQPDLQFHLPRCEPALPALPPPQQQPQQQPQQPCPATPPSEPEQANEEDELMLRQALQKAMGSAA